MDVFSVVFFAALLLGLTAVLGLSYQGVWTQVSGMSTVATAMATELAPVSAVDSMIKLFVNPVNISNSTVLASLTEATFTGYTAQALATIPTPVNDLTLGGFSIYFPSNVFKCTTAPSSAVTVYGAYLIDGNTNLIAAVNFTTPIVIVAVNDSVPLQVTLNFSNGQVNMSASILN